MGNLCFAATQISQCRGSRIESTFSIPIITRSTKEYKLELDTEIFS